MFDPYFTIELLGQGTGLGSRLALGSTNGQALADAARHRPPDLTVPFVTSYSKSVVVGGELLDQGLRVMSRPFAIGALAAKLQGVVGG